MSEVSGEFPQDVKGAKNNTDVTRRAFVRGGVATAVALGVGGLPALDSIAGPVNPESGDGDHAVEELLRQDLQLAAHTRLMTEEHTEAADEGHGEASHGPGYVDWAGAANFFAGVRDLLPGGKGHIDSTRYASLAALLSIKYGQGDPTEREHLEAEFKSVAFSGTVIEGAILLSDALKLDFAEAYQALRQKEIDERDSIALLTMFASVTSPIATTVSSAGLLGNQAQKLAAQLGEVGGSTVEQGVTELTGGDDVQKKEVYRILTAHISNLSGFILAGDPPFLAMIEKYGPGPAIAYQAEACFPLYLQSLYAANQKLQAIRLKQQGVSGSELLLRSRTEALQGIKRNLPVLAAMVGHSAANLLRWVNGNQSNKGIEFDLMGMVKDKVQGAFQLLMSEHIESHEVHDGVGSRTHDIDPHERSEATRLAMELLGGFDGDEGHVEHARSALRLANEIAMIEDERDYDRLRDLMAQYGMSEADIEREIAGRKALADFVEKMEFGRLDDKDMQHQGWLGRIALGPKRMFARATNLDRVKSALGHASADVLNVFPFQALSVPFLVPIFQKFIDASTSELESRISSDQRFAGIEGEELRELAVSNMIASMVTVMSSVADNYVAAKIGLELLPDKPSYALIPAITGGRLTAIGNMANPTLVPLSEYSMGDSLKTIPRGLPSVLLSIAWANAVELGQGKPFMPTPPQPKA